jgi:diguanylate cyclase (GGDEF)-like protein/PAS domain S-box-containing protein
MNAGESPCAREADEEVVALVETLHKAGQRLEELTAGEVDSVLGRDGRTYLLQHAQDELRHSEAVKQAAILNALPAYIALLDTEGFIISVNEAWRRFGSAIVIQAPGYEIGLNYLQICDSTLEDDSAKGHEVAKGIRSVLGGEAKSFSIEYPCHSPTEQRWFLLTVTPLTVDRPKGGAVVMHLDVTEKRQAETTLRVSESRFRQMAENISDVFFLQNFDSSQVYYVSPAYEQIWGRTCESLCANPASWADSIHPDDRDRALTESNKGRTTGFDYEFRIVRANGEMRWIHARGFPILDDAGNPYRTAGVASDISQRKQAEIRIKRLNRVYAVLSQISALIVRVLDREELFREACRIAVEAGAFRMAWIGVIDSQTLEGKVVAWHGGEEGYVDKIRLTARDGTPDSERPACRALRQLQPVICNDIATDLSVAPVRDDLLTRGDKSVGCFPLTVAGRPKAVITLLAGESDFFDDEERRLLLELAGDISFALDHIEKQERLDYLAYYDVLTGLANRGLFIERVAQYMRSAVSGGHKLALGLIDLERFKNINDSLGRPAGDALLRQVAEWLTRNLGDANLAARIGADHFAVVLPQVKQEADVARFVEKTMRALLDHPFRLKDATFRIAAKVGVALFPDDGDDADTLFKNSEAALKKAKANGDRYLFYTQKMTQMAAGTLSLENQLRQALEKEEFVLHYQPKVNLRSGKVTGAEALIRWNDPRTGLVPPGRFIPILEETGLILEVGRWALGQAIGDYMRWRTAGLAAVRIAVNVSPLQLRNRGFIAEIKQAIGIDAQAAAGLELEITENLIMEDVRHSAATLQAIRAMGVTIAIDDFGSGFSSLRYLATLPVHTLKIDRSFVIDMTVSPQGLALVSTIINLARSLKLKVVAEGVETEEQSHLLQLLSCDEMQGYLFSKPVPREIFEARYLAQPPAG